MKQLVFVFIIPIQLLLTIGCCDSHSILPYELHWSTIYLSTIYDVFLLKILRDYFPNYTQRLFLWSTSSKKTMGVMRLQL